MTFVLAIDMSRHSDKRPNGYESSATPTATHPAEPIDIVIAWVDGDDPVHKARRRAYLTGEAEDTRDDIGGEARFRQVGEIEFCVGSVMRFAPFVRRIYIVTDRQNPGLESFVARNFSSPIPIEIVDHSVLFRGYEQYLPVFNSLSIETMLWRIPGLSERFVYLNDDFMLLSSVSRSDWFDGSGRPICYAKRFSSLAARLLRMLKPRRNGHKQFGYKDSMLNAADVVNSGYFWLFGHAPHALLRSRLEAIYAEHPGLLEANISHRFRHESQFNPQALFYIIEERRGNCVVRDGAGRLLFIKPAAGREGYVARKLAEADSMGEKLMFGCVNSFEQAPADDRRRLTDWLEKRMEITTDVQ